MLPRASLSHRLTQQRHANKRGCSGGCGGRSEGLLPWRHPQVPHTPGVLQGGKTWIHAESTSAKDKRQAANTGVCSVQRVAGQPGFSPSSSLAHPWAQAWQAWAGAHSEPPCAVLGPRPPGHCRPCPWPGHSAPRCSWLLCRPCRCRNT